MPSEWHESRLLRAPEDKFFLDRQITNLAVGRTGKKDAGRAVDAWSAFKRTQSQPGGRDLDPKDVLADLRGEDLPLDDPEKVAQMIVERLADAGYIIWPVESPKPPQKP